MNYIGPERQLPGGRPPSPQLLVDQLYLATKEFRHDRTKENLLVIVKLAQELQSIGYTIVWKPKQGCVGCHRKGAPDAQPN